MVKLEMVEMDVFYVYIIWVEWVEILVVDLFLVYEFDVQFEGGIGVVQIFFFIKFDEFVEIVDMWNGCFVDFDCVDFFGFNQLDLDFGIVE